MTGFHPSRRRYAPPQGEVILLRPERLQNPSAVWNLRTSLARCNPNFPRLVFH